MGSSEIAEGVGEVEEVGVGAIGGGGKGRGGLGDGLEVLCGDEG